MKKLLAILLSLVLAFSFVGCNKSDKDKDEAKAKAVDLFEGMVEQLPELDNMNIEGSAEIDFEQLHELGFNEPLVIDMTGEISSFENIKMDVELELGMFPLDAEVYFTGKELLIHSEFIGGILGAAYMSLNLQDIISLVTEYSMENVDYDELKSILKKYQEESEFSIYDILLIENKITEKKITVNEEKIQTQLINTNVNKDSISDVLIDFMTFVANDKEARVLLLNHMTDEEIVEMKEKLLDSENHELIKSTLEGVTINTFQVDFYLNEDLKPVRVDVNVDVTVGYGDESFDMKAKMNLDLFNFGEVEDVIMPEVNPSDVEKILDIISIFL